MFVHAVYFWLRPDLTPQEKETFMRGVHSLPEIETVRHAFVGVPATTNRPVIDRSYSYALTLVFDDLAGQEAYQVHPVHLRFVEQCGTSWTKVQIYDSVGE